MANSYTRDLSFMAGDQTQPTESPYSKFNLALMQMLKQQQSMGTQQFVNAQQQGVQQQAGRIMATPPTGLVGANPALQNQVRQAQAGAMNPTIEGAGKMGKTMSEQISGLSSAIEQARLIGATMQQEETTKRQEAIDMIYKFPTAVKTLDDKTKAAVAKRAGVPIEFIDSLPDAGEDAKTQVVEVNGRKLLINSQTGDTIKDLGTVGGGTTGAGTPTYASETAKRAIDKINSIYNAANNSTTGIGGKVTSAIPGTKSYDLSANLTALKSNIAFGELVAMREASKTGGALGQVSDKEGKLLESALGSLDQFQSEKQFKENLKKIKASLERWQKISAGQLPVIKIDTGETGWITQDEFDSSKYQLISY